MKYTSSVFRYFLLILCFPALATATEIPKPMKDKYQNFYHQPSCDTKELEKLKKKIYELSAGNKPADAWKLIETVLCNEGEKAEKYIMNHMPEKIVSSSYDWESGKDIKKYIPRSNSVLLKKKAWDSTAKIKDGKIKVRYRPNLYCIYSFIIAFKNEKWNLVGLGHFCD